MGVGTSSKRRITSEDLKYLLERTHFTEKQIKKWYKGFIRDCPSGQLNRSTFLDMYSQFFPDGKARSFYEHLFRTFDQDNSGQIDFREFLLAISTTQNGTPEEKLELAFQLYDIDRNGTIEVNEMVQIIKAIYLMVGEPDDQDASPQNRTNAIFERMDINNDGRLTKEEFIKGCLNDDQLFKLLACTDKGSCS